MAAASSSKQSKTVSNLVMASNSWIFLVRLRSFSCPPLLLTEVKELTSSPIPERGPNGVFDLYIPPNTLSKDISVFVSRLEAGEVQVPEGGDLVFQGLALTLLPEEVTLDEKKPASLKLHYGDTPSSAENLALFRLRSEPDEWEYVGGAMDPAAQTISTSITAFGTYGLFLGGGLEGRNFVIRDIQCQPRILSPRGGGFDGRTAISFDLGTARNVGIRIFSVAGRLKRNLEAGRFQPGVNTVFWDGRDDGGRIVRDGPYVVTIQTGGTLETKVVMVVNK